MFKLQFVCRFKAHIFHLFYILSNFPRIHIFGFPSRHHFEEFFMSLLLLINKENDENVVGELRLCENVIPMRLMCD